MKTKQKYAFCIENKDCDDLDIRKVYTVVPDINAENDGYLRVIDESGEDYLYPKSYFILIKLPHRAEQVLAVV